MLLFTIGSASVMLVYGFSSNIGIESSNVASSSSTNIQSAKSFSLGTDGLNFFLSSSTPDLQIQNNFISFSSFKSITQTEVKDSSFIYLVTEGRKESNFFF